MNLNIGKKQALKMYTKYYASCAISWNLDRRLSWLNILLFHYRLLDFEYRDAFFIIPAEPEPSTSVNTPRVRTDLGGGFEDDENVVTTTEAT